MGDKSLLRLGHQGFADAGGCCGKNNPYNGEDKGGGALSAGAKSALTSRTLGQVATPLCKAVRLGAARACFPASRASTAGHVIANDLFRYALDLAGSRRPSRLGSSCSGSRMMGAAPSASLPQLWACTKPRSLRHSWRRAQLPEFNRPDPASGMAPVALRSWEA